METSKVIIREWVDRRRGLRKTGRRIGVSFRFAPRTPVARIRERATTLRSDVVWRLKYGSHERYVFQAVGLLELARCEEGIRSPFAKFSSVSVVDTPTFGIHHALWVVYFCGNGSWQIVPQPVHKAGNVIIVHSWVFIYEYYEGASFVIPPTDDTEKKILVGPPTINESNQPLNQCSFKRRLCRRHHTKFSRPKRFNDRHIQTPRVGQILWSYGVPTTISSLAATRPSRILSCIQVQSTSSPRNLH